MNSKTNALPSLDRINRSFTSAVAGAGGIGGSVISFLVSGAFVWALIRLARRDFPLAVDRNIRLIALVFAAYTLGELALALIHFEGGRNLSHIVQKLPFLAFLPIYSRLALSERGDILKSLEDGAGVGALLALCAAIAEIASGAERASGGAGNPGPFALVSVTMYAICIQGFLRATGDRLRGIAMLAGATCAAVALLLSGTRALWPALILAPAILLIANHRLLGSLRAARYFMTTIAAALLVTFVLGNSLVAARLDALKMDAARSLEHGDYDNSFGQRLIMWEFGFQQFAKAPLFGPGTAAALSGMTDYSRKEYGFALVRSHFHNAAIDAAARGGLFSLALLVATVLVAPLLAWRKQRDDTGQAGFALMLAITANYLTAGTLGLMFGHDIQDHLYVYMMIVTAFLVFGASERRARMQLSQAAPLR